MYSDLKTWPLVAVLILLGWGLVQPAASAEPGKLQAKRVAVLLDEGFQDAEAFFPMGYLANRGLAITVIGPARGEVKAYNSDAVAVIEKSVQEVEAEQFDVLIIPGGQAPARLRQHEDVVSFVRSFAQSGKPVAAICHGPQLLAAAGVLEGRRVTCVGGVSQDMVAAGAEYVDEPVVRDGNLITSRVPRDLPAFAMTIVSAMDEQR